MPPIENVSPSRFLSSLFVALFGISGAVRAAPPGSDGAVIRAMELLKTQCAPCHNPTKKKGGLVLVSAEGLETGGDNGAVVVPGQLGQSPLLQVLEPDADPHMPPRKQLADEEIAVLRAWVESGAAWDAEAFAGAASAPVIDPDSLRSLPGSYHPVLALSLSQDDRRLAVGRGAGVFVYDCTATNHVLLHRLAGQDDAVQSVVWSPDGKWLAAGGFRRIRIWETGGYTVAAEVKDLVGRVPALAFSPDSSLLVAADGVETQSGVIRVWDVLQSGRLDPLARWTAHDDTILDLKISPDGTTLASAGVDTQVKLWRIPGFEALGTLEGHNGHVTSLAFHADGSVLVSGGADGEVKIWELKTRDQRETVTGHPGPVTALGWSADGKKIVTVCEDGIVRICDEEKKRPERSLGSAGDVVYALALSSDGTRSYGGCHDGLVRVWDKDGKLQGQLSGEETLEP
jgi:WD40 repeat protein